MASCHPSIFGSLLSDKLGILCPGSSLQVTLSAFCRKGDKDYTKYSISSSSSLIDKTQYFSSHCDVFCLPSTLRRPLNPSFLTLIFSPPLSASIHKHQISLDVWVFFLTSLLCERLLAVAAATWLHAAGETHTSGTKTQSQRANARALARSPQPLGLTSFPSEALRSRER